MLVFRQCDPRYPFVWESSDQPPARWHGEGEGPAHYFADTPWGAWAEYLRHEEITEAEDLAGIRRALWAVEIGDPPELAPKLSDELVRGPKTTYPSCQAEARRSRRQGRTGLVAPSAALANEEAAGWVVDFGLRRASRRDPQVIVLFGTRPDLEGWLVVQDGRPDAGVLPHVHQL